MKISLSYNVKSKTILPGNIEIEKEDRTYVFHADDKRMLSKIEMIAKAPDPERFYSEIIKTPNEQIKTTVKVNSDGALIENLEEDFRSLESLLALECNLKTIGKPEVTKSYVKMRKRKRGPQSTA